MKLEELTALIPLTQGKHAIVDRVNYERLSKHKWYAMKIGRTYYARRTKRIGRRSENKKINIYMHQEILSSLPTQEIDHIDGNGLHNKLNNLRICLHSENQKNRKPQKNGTSKYKGVFWNKKLCKWQVSISINNKTKYLGLYNNEKEAAKVYNYEAIRQYGEFVRLNII